MATRLLPATLQEGFGASRKCPEQLEKVSGLPESVPSNSRRFRSFPKASRATREGFGASRKRPEQLEKVSGLPESVLSNSRRFRSFPKASRIMQEGFVIIYAVPPEKSTSPEPLPEGDGAKVRNILATYHPCLMNTGERIVRCFVAAGIGSRLNCIIGLKALILPPLSDLQKVKESLSFKT